MTIRSAILRGSLALVFGSILLSGALSFFEFRQALQTEIARTLQVNSTALQERIDAFLFDRVEDVREWRSLEVMQDIRVGDVDKRLSRLLSDLKQGHGPMYDALFCTDGDGRVVASTSPGLIGTVRPPGPTVIRDNRPGNAEVVVEAFEPQHGTGGSDLVLRTSVPNAFGRGSLGHLYAVLNWNHVVGFLREAVAGTPRTALLLDARGHTIASWGPQAPASALPARNLTDWMGAGIAGGARTRSGSILGTGPLLVGTAQSSGYHALSGFDWHLLMVEPTRVAFAPVWRLAGAMLLVLVLTMAVAGWMSRRLSSRIARPLTDLTAFARRLRGGEEAPPPKVDGGITEVRELSGAFAEMLEALSRSREQLVRAGKLAVVGEMAATMAHEVRTPLGILRSSAQLLERQPGLTPEGRELTGYIQSETDRLGRLVTTLLETARPRPPQFRATDLAEVLEHAVALVESRAAKRSIALQMHVGADDTVLSCDREQLIQVFLNLLINAIPHTPEGGTVGVRLEGQPGAIVVHVDDNGPGVAPADRARVFDPFFSQREGGIGLGLTVVQQIVQAHGGDITVAASPAGGARFTVRLPTATEESAP